jgi:hypothetical protein
MYENVPFHKTPVHGSLANEAEKQGFLRPEIFTGYLPVHVLHGSKFDAELYGDMYDSETDRGTRQSFERETTLGDLHT